MANPADGLTLTEAREKLNRMSKRFKDGVEAAKKPLRTGLMSSATIAGGGTAGIVRAVMPNIPGTDYPLDGALGTIITAVGLMMVGGGEEDFGDGLAAYGEGMAAPSAARFTETAMTGILAKIKEATTSSSSTAKP